MLSSAISAALSDKVHRPDDIEFCVAARGWSECVSFGNFDLYQRRFTETARKSFVLWMMRKADDAEYFAPRFEEATKVGGRMIKAIQDGRKKQ